MFGLLGAGTDRREDDGQEPGAGHSSCMVRSCCAASSMLCSWRASHCLTRSVCGGHGRRLGELVGKEVPPLQPPHRWVGPTRQRARGAWPPARPLHCHSSPGQSRHLPRGRGRLRGQAGSWVWPGHRVSTGVGRAQRGARSSPSSGTSRPERGTQPKCPPGGSHPVLSQGLPTPGPALPPTPQATSRGTQSSWGQGRERVGLPQRPASSGPGASALWCTRSRAALGFVSISLGALAVLPFPEAVAGG